MVWCVAVCAHMQKVCTWQKDEYKFTAVLSLLAFTKQNTTDMLQRKQSSVFRSSTRLTYLLQLPNVFLLSHIFLITTG